MGRLMKEVVAETDYDKRAGIIAKWKIRNT